MRSPLFLNRRDTILTLIYGEHKRMGDNRYFPFFMYASQISYMTGINYAWVLKCLHQISQGKSKLLHRRFRLIDDFYVGHKKGWVYTLNQNGLAVVENIPIQRLTDITRSIGIAVVESPYSRGSTEDNPMWIFWRDASENIPAFLAFNPMGDKTIQRIKTVDQLLREH